MTDTVVMENSNSPQENKAPTDTKAASRGNSWDSFIAERTAANEIRANTDPNSQTLAGEAVESSDTPEVTSQIASEDMQTVPESKTVKKMQSRISKLAAQKATLTKQLADSRMETQMARKAFELRDREAEADRINPITDPFQIENRKLKLQKEIGEFVAQLDPEVYTADLREAEQLDSAADEIIESALSAVSKYKGINPMELVERQRYDRRPAEAIAREMWLVAKADREQAESQKSQHPRTTAIRGNTATSRAVTQTGSFDNAFARFANQRIGQKTGQAR